MFLNQKLLEKAGLIIILLLLTLPSFSQIKIQNPSLEGPSGQGIVPYPWVICSQTPDTDPNSGVHATLNFSASDGLTYVGMLSYPPYDDYYESFSQKLECPLAKGALSNFSVDLAYVELDNSISAGGILVYGGFNICDTAQLLWKSPDTETTWHRYTASFIPNDNYNYIIIWPYADQPPYRSSYIVIDNFSPIIEIDNAGRVLAHTDSTEINTGSCVQLSAQVANSIATNISWVSIPVGFSSTQLNAGKVCPTVSTSYIVTITDTCGLTSRDTIYIKLKGDTGVKQLTNDAVYQYLTQDGLLKFNALPVTNNLQIYNLLGQQLFQTSSYQNNFSTRLLPSSMYFYRLKTNGNEYKGKFEVVR